MNVLEIVKDVYTFACVLIGIEIEDLKGRVTYLTEQNIKWFNKAETAEKELAVCQEKIKHLEERLQSESPSESQPTNEG